MVKLTTNQKGAIAEAVIAAEAIKLGINVLKPVAEHGRYELAIDMGSEVIRVQCKWGGVKGDVINASAIGSYHSPTRGYVRSTYGSSVIDALGV